MGVIFKRWRWGLFAAGAIFGLMTWVNGAKSDFSPLFFLEGLAAMLAAFLLVATDIARWLASPFLRYIDSIYMPAAKNEKAPLTYDLPLYYERHLRSEEALEAYEAIIKAYPDQINAYAGAIRVCEQQLQDHARARRWRRNAERLFGYETVAQAVAKTAEDWHAERIKSALAPAPSQ